MNKMKIKGHFSVYLILHGVIKFTDKMLFTLIPQGYKGSLTVVAELNDPCA